jgi:hypothetical protein
MSKLARLFALCLLIASFSFAQQTPSFTSPRQYGPITDYPQDFFGIDVNNDGHTDLIAISGGDAGSAVVLNVFLNNGDGTFNGPITESSGTLHDTGRMGIADFNGDGNLDVALASYQLFTGDNTPAVNTGQVQVLYGDGTGHFSAGPVVSVAPGNPNSIAVADFNGDGRFDIATADTNDKTIALLLNNGSGGFNKTSFQATTYWDNLQPGTTLADAVGNLVAGDFNGDRRADLAYVDECNEDSCPDVPQEQLWTALNNGNGTFSAVNTNNGSTGLRRLLSADIDLDGKSDLYYVYDGCHTPCYGVTVLFSNDGRNFTATQPFGGQNGFRPFDVIAADFNNDSRIDLAFTTFPDFVTANPGFDVVVATGKRTWSTTSKHFSMPTNNFTTLITTGFLHSSYRKDVALVDGNELVQVFGNADPNASGTCGYYSTISVHLCAPVNGSTVTSPVRIYAAFHPEHYPWHRTEIWIDGVKKLQVYNDRVDSSFSLANGTHTVTIAGVDMTNRALKKSSTFSIGGSTACSVPTSAGVHICSPAAGSIVSSPVTIKAAARAGSGNITAMRIYIDGVAKFTQNNSSASTTMQLSTSLSVASGTHTLSVVGYQSTGGAVKASETFTVK